MGAHHDIYQLIKEIKKMMIAHHDAHHRDEDISRHGAHQGVHQRRGDVGITSS